MQKSFCKCTEPGSREAQHLTCAILAQFLEESPGAASMRGSSWLSVVVAASRGFFQAEPAFLAVQRPYQLLSVAGAAPAPAFRGWPAQTLAAEPYVIDA